VPPPTKIWGSSQRYGAEDRRRSFIGKAISFGGTKNSHIATLVERHSRFTALIKVRSKDTAAIVAAIRPHAISTGQDSTAYQSTSVKNFGLSDSSKETAHKCCADPLNPQR
jgi:IS30 family transposase